MKLGHWHSRPHQAEPTASQLVPALDRVREMREHSAWEPLTSQSNIQGRAERVSTVRQQITIPPLASQHNARGIDDWKRIWFLDAFGALLIVITGALAILLVWLTLIAE